MKTLLLAAALLLAAGAHGADFILVPGEGLTGPDGSRFPLRGPQLELFRLLQGQGYTRDAGPTQVALRVELKNDRVLFWEVSGGTVLYRGRELDLTQPDKTLPALAELGCTHTAGAFYVCGAGVTFENGPQGLAVRLAHSKEKEPPCVAAVGKLQASSWADQCLRVSPSPSPPCHPASHGCGVIQSEILRGCEGRRQAPAERPPFCTSR